MWDQLVATRLDAKQHWSISKCQKHVPTPDRKLFCANMGNVLLFYVNKQILIFQYFFILSEPLLEWQLWLFQKIIRNITYYSSIVITGICTCLRALFCWFKKQQLLLFAYNEQTHLLQKKLCCLFANWYSRPFISIVIWPLRKDIYTLHKDNWNAKIYDSLR